MAQLFWLFHNGVQVGVVAMQQTPPPPPTSHMKQNTHTLHVEENTGISGMVV